jgi:hypothetical protein
VNSNIVPTGTRHLGLNSDNNRWESINVNTANVVGIVNCKILSSNGLDIGLNITPKTDNVSTLGTSDFKWNTVYATTFSGNATSADKLNTNKGSASKPVYFSGGKPVECTGIDNTLIPAASTSTLGGIKVGYGLSIKSGRLDSTIKKINYDTTNGITLSCAEKMVIYTASTT